MLKHLEKRAEVLCAIRNFFTHNGYLEVETPLRIPNPIPEEHIDPFESEGWYLQSSPEICMKRLAAQGYEKIFQICKCFRKDERGALHLAEFTMLEWYRKDYSYMELMDECKEMIKSVAQKCSILGKLKYGNYEIKLNEPWQMITVSEAFEKYSNMTMEEAEYKGIFDEVMAFEIEPCLGFEVPTFIYDYPASKASLAKLKSVKINSNEKVISCRTKRAILDKNFFAERFELYIAGIELANGFSELIDPSEQKERLEKEIKKIKKRHIEEGKYISTYSRLIQIPEKFIQDLKKLPPTAGIALGVDRLVMILTNTTTIDEVVAFTTEEL